jgi:hypothetical protein
MELIGSPPRKAVGICRTSQTLIIEVGQAKAVLIHDQFYPGAVVFGNRRRQSAPGPLQQKSMSLGMSAIWIRAGLVVLNVSFVARDPERSLTLLEPPVSGPA